MSCEENSRFDRETDGAGGKMYHVPQLDVKGLKKKRDVTSDHGGKVSAIHTSLPGTVARDYETKKNSDGNTVAKDQGTIKNSINHDLDDVAQVTVFYKTEKEPMLHSEIKIITSN